MAKYRITFRSEIYVESDSAENALNEFVTIPLYNKDAVTNNSLDFCEVVSVEDEEGNDCM